MNGGIGPDDAELGVEAPEEAGVLRPDRREDLAMVEMDIKHWNAARVSGRCRGDVYCFFGGAFKYDASGRLTCPGSFGHAESKCQGSDVYGGRRLKRREM